MKNNWFQIWNYKPNLLHLHHTNKQTENMRLTAKQEIAKSIKLTKQLQVVQKSIADLERKIFLSMCNKTGNVLMMREELRAKWDMESRLIDALISL